MSQRGPALYVASPLTAVACVGVSWDAGVCPFSRRAVGGGRAAKANATPTPPAKGRAPPPSHRLPHMQMQGDARTATGNGGAVADTSTMERWLGGSVAVGFVTSAPGLSCECLGVLWRAAAVRVGKQNTHAREPCSSLACSDPWPLLHRRPRHTVISTARAPRPSFLAPLLPLCTLPSARLAASRSMSSTGMAAPAAAAVASQASSVLDGTAFPSGQPPAQPPALPCMRHSTSMHRRCNRSGRMHRWSHAHT